MLAGIVALLMWDVLSFYGKLPFGDVAATMLLGEGISILNPNPSPNPNPRPSPNPSPSPSPSPNPNPNPNPNQARASHF